MAAPTSVLPISLEPTNPTFAGQCPLVATDISVQVTGLVASYQVIQRFLNTSEEPLEVIVKLPLPDGAVVHRLVVRQKERILTAKVKERTHAQSLYDNARARGQHAVIAEEARPNLMELKVTGILPKTPVEVEALISSPLVLEGGEVRLSFPTTMTPRYVHPSTTPEDARRISPPFAQNGERLYGVSFLVELDALAPLGAISSPSHSLLISQQSAQRAIISLKEGEVLPDKDIVIVYQVVAGIETPMLSSFRPADGEAASFMLTLPPPVSASEEEIVPRHVSFLLDRSGSMAGDPMESAKRALRGLLRSLGPRDQFSIIAFGSRFTDSGTSPVSDASLASADSFLSGIDASGGTEILPALQRALEFQVPAGYSRVVVLLTDGSVSNEEQIFSSVRQAVARHGLRAHAFGIGSSVNRHLVKGFAKSGRGVSDFANEMTSLEPMLARFQASAGAPIATDISIDVEGSLVSFTPKSPSDIDLGRPLTIFGRCLDSKDAAIVLRAKMSGRSFERRYPLQIAAGAHGNPALQALWARSYLDELCEDQSKNREEILRVSLSSQVLSPLTAWVAVENGSETGQEPTTVEVPLHMPAGTQSDARPWGDSLMKAGGPGAAPARSSLSFDANAMPAADSEGGGATLFGGADFKASRSTVMYCMAEVPKAMAQKDGALSSARYRGAAIAPSRGSAGLGSTLLKIVGFPFVALAAIFVGLFGLVSKLFQKKPKRAVASPAPVHAKPIPLVSAPRAEVKPQLVQASAPQNKNMPVQRERAEAALRFLARAQSASGAFVDAETTKRVLDAFASCGETPERGLYRRQLSRARDFWQKAGAPSPTKLNAPSLEVLLTSQAKGGENDGAILGHGDSIQMTAAFVSLVGAAQGASLGQVA